MDERSEIAGCLHGIPQNDVGIRTDVLDGCPKVEGMMLLVRSMAPEILAVDEIGGMEDFSPCNMPCGVDVICWQRYMREVWRNCFKSPGGTSVGMIGCLENMWLFRRKMEREGIR